MTNEQVGQYIRLLCYQWELDGLPETPEELNQLASCNGIAAAVQRKFHRHEDGKIRNDRLHSEWIKKDKISGIQAKKAHNRWKNNATAYATALPQDMQRVCQRARGHSHSHNSDSESISKKAAEAAKEKTTTTTATQIFNPHLNPPKKEQVIEEAIRIGYPMSLEDAEAFISKYGAIGWEIKGSPIRDWRHMLTRWKAEARKIRPETQRQYAPIPEPPQKCEMCGKTFTGPAFDGECPQCAEKRKKRQAELDALTRKVMKNA